MRKFISIIIACFSVVMLSSCKDDEVVDPSIETLDITTTSASSFIAKGKINTVGTIQVLDYGFVYSSTQNPNPDLTYGTIVSLGSKPVAGNFEQTISMTAQTGYYYNMQYTVRAYITNKKGTVYGKVKTFGFPSLSVYTMNPTTGKAGDIITITGNNFSTSAGLNTVLFNTTPAVVTSATTTSLQVEVPADITSNYYNDGVVIYVSTGAQTQQAPGYFFIKPSFADFTPKSGSFGTTITITGGNFNYHYITIQIGDITVSPDNVTSNTIMFRVPAALKTETPSIRVIVDNSDLPSNNLGVFNILPPTISSVSPSSGPIGSLVSITGLNFNVSDYYNNSNKVKFGDIEATLYQSTSSTEIQVYVPTGLTVGEQYDISVNTGIHTIKAQTEFKIVAPVFTDFSPKTVQSYSYAYITITGSNFGNVNGNVIIGGEEAGIYSWNNNSIQVQVPYYLSAGTYKITINVGGQSAISTSTLTIE